MTKPAPLMHSSSSSSWSLIKSESLRSLLKKLLWLVVGLIMGIQFTILWFDDVPIEHKSINFGKHLSLNLTGSRHHHSAASNSTAEYLYNNTRVLCWITTHPTNHMNKAIHIRHTWGRRCNKLLFISTEEDDRLPTVQIPVKEGGDHLWTKTRLTLKYIYDHYLDDADWFLKAEDDTYVIMENLRMMLYQYSPNLPIYFGCKLRRHIEPDYVVGGSGVVLSKTALIKFMTEAYNNSEICDIIQTDQDRDLSKCLDNIGVIAGDSRDEKGLERFVPMQPFYVIPTFKMEWYPIEIYHRPNENVSCCSPNAVSFHYFDPRAFYIYDYLIYHLRPFGVFENVLSNLPLKFNDDDILSKGMENKIATTMDDFI
ncbi:glycoprotein-N-acetylgalactosamine 3-beta-galactosyltransferase 1-like [Haematobia irritans]|uniref:glycoprotein-N-acetylgalactosamine 3-beta-galactosyltransferase 1-like n=1 Tax=Haematobia irritans TaxID=7368 RepID=UPI003F50BCFC